MAYYSRQTEVKSSVNPPHAVWGPFDLFFCLRDRVRARITVGRSRIIVADKDSQVHHQGHANDARVSYFLNNLTTTSPVLTV